MVPGRTPAFSCGGRKCSEYKEGKQGASPEKEETYEESKNSVRVRSRQIRSGTKGWIVTDSLVKIERPDGTIVCPYIKHRRGRTFIGEGDYIIVQQDGTKNVCGADKVWTRYEKPEA